MPEIDCLAATFLQRRHGEPVLSKNKNEPGLAKPAKALRAFLGLLCLSAAWPSSVVLAAEVAWEKEILLGVPGEPGTSYIADLDGDGRDELLMLSGPVQIHLGTPQITTLSMLGALPDGGWGLRSAHHFDAPLREALILRRPGGDAIAFPWRAGQVSCCEADRLDIYSGWPPRLEHSVGSEGASQFTGMGDIAGDGDIEWLEYGRGAAPQYAYEVRLRALPDGRIKWRAPFNGLVQTIDDLDPAKGQEIVVLTSREGLVVLSGASGLPLGSSPSLSNLASAATGNFDADPATREIGHFDGTTMHTVVTAPVSIQDFFWVADGSSSLTAWLPFDLDSDGRDEMLISAGSSVRIIDPVTGALRTQGLGTQSDRAFQAGDVLPRPGEELLQVAAPSPSVWDSGEPWAITVRDPGSFEMLHSVPGYREQTIVPALGDVDGVAGLEVVIALPSARGIRLEVRGLPDGQLLREAEFLHPDGALRAAATRLVVESPKAQRPARIALITGSANASRMRWLDGASLAVLGEYLLQDAVGNVLAPMDVRLADIDSDETPDLLFSSRLGQGIYLHRLDAATGRLLWSAQGADPESLDRGTRANLAIRQLTAAGPSQAFLWSGQRLYLIDAGSGQLLSAHHLASTDASLLSPIESAGKCQFGLRSLWGLSRWNCDTLEHEGRLDLYYADRSPLWMDFADDLDGGYLSLEGDRLLELSGRGTIRRSLALLPAAKAGIRADGIQHLRSGDTRVLVLAVQGGVHVMQLNGVRLFDSSFERH